MIIQINSSFWKEIYVGQESKLCMEHVEMLKMWMENGMVAIINGIECATSEM